MGSSFSSSALPNPPESANVATEEEWGCPICCDAQNDVVYAMPCCHQFCLGCIVRWTNVKPECPLCRRLIESIRFSVQGEDDYVQHFVTPPTGSPDASSQAGRAPGHLAEAEQGAAAPEAVGGLLPEVWAGLFQRRQHLLHPVLSWLHWELEAIYGAQWWLAKSAGSSILYALCTYGPREELMVQMLQPLLEEHAEPLIRGLIDVIVHRCSEEAQRLL